MEGDRDDGILKTCTGCGEAKALVYFPLHKARGGYRSKCKVCSSKIAAKWRSENADRNKEYNDAWYLENKIERNRKARLWQIANPEKVKSYQEKWLTDNPERAREQKKRADDKKRSTLKGRLENNIKAAVHRGLVKGGKNGRRTFAVLGYSIDMLIAHIEGKFLPGMTWENYGSWHVDHRIPLAAHNYETPDDHDFKRAWALNNLQPLWAADNHSKSDRLDAPFQPSFLLQA